MQGSVFWKITCWKAPTLDEELVKTVLCMGWAMQRVFQAAATLSTSTYSAEPPNVIFSVKHSQYWPCWLFNWANSIPSCTVVQENNVSRLEMLMPVDWSYLWMVFSSSSFTPSRGISLCVSLGSWYGSCDAKVSKGLSGSEIQQMRRSWYAIPLPKLIRKCSCGSWDLAEIRNNPRSCGSSMLAPVMVVSSSLKLNSNFTSDGLRGFRPSIQDANALEPSRKTAGTRPQHWLLLFLLMYLTQFF